MILQKYKSNYLLIGAVFFYCTFLIIYFSIIYFDIITFEELNNKSRLNSVNNLKMLMISAILIAPIIEELVFRGYFTNNKNLKFLSIIGLPLFIFFTKSFYLIIIIPYIGILLFDYFSFKKINTKILFISNALIFAIIHYKVEHFNEIITIIPILAQFGTGLLLIWVVINFNIKTSILIHSLHNLIILLPLIIILQFPPKTVNFKEVENYKITWNKIPIFNNELTLIKKPNDFEISANNISPIDLYKTYVKLEDNINLYNKEPFFKYNIVIKKLNSSAIKLDSLSIKNLLIESELIIEN